MRRPSLSKQNLSEVFPSAVLCNDVPTVSLAATNCSCCHGGIGPARFYTSGCFNFSPPYKNIDVRLFDRIGRKFAHLRSRFTNSGRKLSFLRRRRGSCKGVKTLWNGCTSGSVSSTRTAVAIKNCRRPAWRCGAPWLLQRSTWIEQILLWRNSGRSRRRLLFDRAKPIEYRRTVKRFLWKATKLRILNKLRIIKYYVEKKILNQKCYCLY